MNRRRPTAGEPSPEIVDAVIDGYVAWREQSAVVSLTYERWSCAEPAERESAFADYSAALDREEWAAARYQWLISRVSTRQSEAEHGSASVDQAA
jgi:hypothetical protein